MGKLMGVHLDYALALLMPFKLVVLEHIGGLRPVWVTVETENEKRSWSPSSYEKDAKEVLSQFGLSVGQGQLRGALENVLKSQVGPAVDIPILTSPDVASIYSDEATR
ncbi:hypothetical protein [Salinicola tamaricis]|uniref:hypothetical protein n=1 Tax=Salinicola tamaricis TaxID=1771309 RepID=UPI0013EA0EFB|nr:hypothetical protein [Salinicola tamaricis]